jgi:hypothetical protein
MATVPATRPRGGDADYTHRTWKTEMIKAVTIFNAITYVLDNMERSLVGMGAGETQLRWVRLCRSTAADIVAQTVEFVGVINKRYDPVADAVAAAGGQREVADVKEYYQTG